MHPARFRWRMRSTNITSQYLSAYQRISCGTKESNLKMLPGFINRNIPCQCTKPFKRIGSLRLLLNISYRLGIPTSLITSWIYPVEYIPGMSKTHPTLSNVSAKLILCSFCSGVNFLLRMQSCSWAYRKNDCDAGNIWPPYTASRWCARRGRSGIRCRKMCK